MSEETAHGYRRANKITSDLNKVQGNTIVINPIIYIIYCFLLNMVYENFIKYVLYVHRIKVTLPIIYLFVYYNSVLIFCY